MSQSANLIAVFEAIGFDVGTLFSNQGDLASLTTVNKSNLVAALNEVRGVLSATINNAIITNSTTYSSLKIEAVVSNAIAAIVDSAPEEYNTLGKVAQYIEDNDLTIGEILIALNNRVRFDAPQSLTLAQQIQASTNTGVGDISTDFVAAYNIAKA